MSKNKKVACGCGGNKDARSKECLTCRQSKHRNPCSMLKICKLCKEEKHIQFFRVLKKDGHLFPYCKECSYLKVREWEFLNPDKQLNLHIRRKFKRAGEIPTDYHVNLFKQTINCNLCNNLFVNNKDKHTDHCHVTKKFRGILCSRCNLGIGLFMDSVYNFNSAIAYLQLIDRSFATNLLNDRLKNDVCREEKRRIKKKNFTFLGIEPKEAFLDYFYCNEACEICGFPEFRGNYSLSIDHCHLTGKFRGLLCSKCNFGLGKFEDSVMLLNKAIFYLEKFNDY